MGTNTTPEFGFGQDDDDDDDDDDVWANVAARGVYLFSCEEALSISLSLFSSLVLFVRFGGGFLSRHLQHVLNLLSDSQ